MVARGRLFVVVLVVALAALAASPVALGASRTAGGRAVRGAWKVVLYLDERDARTGGTVRVHMASADGGTVVAFHVDRDGRHACRASLQPTSRGFRGSCLLQLGRIPGRYALDASWVGRDGLHVVQAVGLTVRP